MATSSRPRCGWVHNDPIEVAYHDEEWGVPLHNDQKLFEFLVLDGFQAGLSWLTILRKRTAFQQAFDQFDPTVVAAYDDARLQTMMGNRAIVRNRLKIQAAVTNAQAFLKVQEAYGSFDAYLWGWVNGAPIQNRWPTLEEVPARTELSDAFSKDLKQHGFKFVGSVICYAFMQAVGMVNDHTVDCFRHAELR